MLAIPAPSVHSTAPINMRQGCALPSFRHTLVTLSRNCKSDHPNQPKSFRPRVSCSMLMSTEASSDLEKGWIEVWRKRTASLGSVLQGTAAPGSTKLEESERWSYLHLYYVKQGTSDSQVREHLATISESDVCIVEILKARGSYAFFKLPSKYRLNDKQVMLVLN